MITNGSMSMGQTSVTATGPLQKASAVLPIPLTVPTDLHCSSNEMRYPKCCADQMGCARLRLGVVVDQQCTCQLSHAYLATSLAQCSSPAYQLSFSVCPHLYCRVSCIRLILSRVVLTGHRACNTFQLHASCNKRLRMALYTDRVLVRDWTCPSTTHLPISSSD